jgi:hypothetical protein
MLGSIAMADNRLSFSVVVTACAFSLAFAIPELVISRKFWDDGSNDCHNGSLLEPVVWMFWDGIAGLILVACYLILALHYSDTTHLLFNLVVEQLAKLGVLLGGLFAVAWAIIGGVVLWRDNDGPCEPKELHDSMWAFVIIDIVFAGITLMSSR